VARLENTIADFDGQPVLWRLLLRAINEPKMPTFKALTVRPYPFCLWDAIR